MHRHGLIRLALIVTTALLLVASLTLTKSQYGGTLVVGYVSEVDSIDHHVGQTTVGRSVLSLSVEGLVDWDANMNLKPGLATSWKASSDGLTWIFNLRKGVKFHNGKEMTAEDVKWSIDRVMNPKLGAAFKANYDSVDKVEVVDKYTVRFVMKKQDGVLPCKLNIASGILCKGTAPFDTRIDSPSQIVGTGPFKLVSWSKNDQMKFERFKDYWVEGLPYVDTVIEKPIPDSTVRLAALRKGDVDIIEWVPLDEAARLIKTPSSDFTIAVGPRGAETGYICMNETKPPFNDVRVRQAVAYAIDKDQITAGAWRGFGESVNQPFVPSSDWYCDVTDKYRKPNIEKAKELLKQAGYPDGFKVKWATTTGYAYMLALAQVAQGHLKKVGIDAELEVYDWATYASKMAKLEFTMYNTGVPGLPDPVQFYNFVYKHDSPFNWIAGGYNNPVVDKLVDDAEKATDFNQRKALYKKIVEIIEVDLPLIYCSTGVIGFGWRSRVIGFKPHTNSIHTYAGGGVAYTQIKQ